MFGFYIRVLIEVIISLSPVSSEVLSSSCYSNQIVPGVSLGFRSEIAHFRKKKYELSPFYVRPLNMDETVTDIVEKMVFTAST